MGFLSNKIWVRIFLGHPGIYEAFTAIFLEQPSFRGPDTCEDKWFDKRNPYIDIQSMALPLVK